MKYALSVLIISLGSLQGYAQDAANWAGLFSDQKKYITTEITPEHRATYLEEIHVAHIAHSKIWAEIKKVNPSFNFNGNWNMVEKFSQGKLNGVLWSGTLADTIYQFSYASDQKLIINQYTLAQLPDTISTIVSNFHNWENPIFAHHGNELKAPRDRPFYLGIQTSRIDRKIICFYYP